MDLSRFRKPPLLGILRGIEPSMIEPITELSVAAGLSAVEITMNTEGAPFLIERMVRAAEGRLMVGAGTVLTRKAMNQALDAGATFIVLPTMIDEVVEPCVAKKIPVFPGALTPDEIHRAWKAGATMVKVFPANLFGPKYFREIHGPLEEIPLLACGGVNEATLPDYFACGAAAAAFGGSLFQKELLREGRYDEIEVSLRRLVRRFVEWKERGEK